MEIPLDLSLLSTKRGRANQCPWSEELTNEALSVASPTCNVLIAVINSPRQHLEAVWAINERVRQWRSVLFCGLQDNAWGAVNAFIEQAEDLEHAPAIQTPTRCEWCNHRRCCFNRLWRGFGADRGGGWAGLSLSLGKVPCARDQWWGHYPTMHQNAEHRKTATRLQSIESQSNYWINERSLSLFFFLVPKIFISRE